VRFLVLAAALAVVAVPGAAGEAIPRPVLLSYGPAVISPNGNGVHDTLTLNVRAEGAVDLRAYVWGGRLHGWRELRTGVSGIRTLRWTPSALGDGSYLVTLCYKDRGRRLAPVIAPREQRPGPAEETVSRPPWRYSGCLAKPRVVRVERLAAYVDSTRSFEPGSDPPLVVSADAGRTEVALEGPCRNLFAGRDLPRGIRSGLYHYAITDRAHDTAEAPVVVRNPAFPIDRPPPHTALVVWPYLTWRAYNSYDADLNGIPDSWYHFWRNRRVSLRGTILPGGQEDDYKAALPFSQWLCARHPRVQSVTDAELGRLPLSVLRRYRAVVFPGHSEYYEPHTWKLLRDYRDQGGHLVFLQANPFYRQVKLVKDRNAMVMTDFDARDHGFSDFALAGVGYDGCCFPKAHAARYVSATGDAYARVRWLFRGTGIGPGQAFGYAGSESDRIDPQLTPRDHVVAARAIIPGNYGVVNAALVWSRAGRGEVFATGNYSFLRMNRALTWTLLDNVWRKLVS
jgi:N,N-dimethylformamidase beta subunit-like, C-terminal